MVTPQLQPPSPAAFPPIPTRQQRGPTPQALMELLRRIQAQKLTQQGVQNIGTSFNQAAQQGVPRVAGPQGIPTAQVQPSAPPTTPSGGGQFPTISLPGLPEFNILNKLVDIVPGPTTGVIGSQAQQALRNVEQPLAAASQAIATDPFFVPGLSQAGVLGEIRLPGISKEDDTGEIARSEIGKLISGEQSLGETRANLQSLQKTRSGAEQIISEIAGPFGLAENLVPLGLPSKIGKTGRAIQESLQAVPFEPKLIVTLPTAKETFKQVFTQRPSVIAATDKLPAPFSKLFKLPYRIFNPNALNSVDDPVRQMEAVLQRAEEIVPEAANAMSQRVLAMGDPTDLFRLDPQNGFRSSLPGFNGLTFNEIAENLDDLRVIDLLSPEQNAWFQRFGQIVNEMNDYLVSLGIPREALFASKVDNYFPRVWAMFNDIELRRGGRGKLGSVPFYEKFRAYDTVEDALQAGFSPANPMEAVEILFNSMYKQVMDQQAMDVIRPFGFTINQRMGPKVIETVRDATVQLDGIKQASAFVRTLSTVGRAPKSGTSLAGRSIAEQGAPDIMARLDEIATIRLKADRDKAFKELRTETAQRTSHRDG